MKFGNGQPFPSTYQQVVENMRRITELVDEYIQKLINTIFNPEAVENGSTDIWYDEIEKKLKVIGMTIDDDKVDEILSPDGYVRDLSWELKKSNILDLAGEKDIGEYVTVMTVRLPDGPRWQVAYSEDHMTSYFRKGEKKPDGTWAWGPWESVGRKQFVKSADQPANNLQDVGDYWYTDITPIPQPSTSPAIVGGITYIGGGCVYIRAIYPADSTITVTRQPAGGPASTLKTLTMTSAGSGTYMVDTTVKTGDIFSATLKSGSSNLASWTGTAVEREKTGDRLYRKTGDDQYERMYPETDSDFVYVAGSDYTLSDKIRDFQDMDKYLEAWLDSLDKREASHYKELKDADAKLREDFEAADAQLRKDFQDADSQLRKDFQAADSALESKLRKEYQDADNTLEGKLRKEYQDADRQIRNDFTSGDTYLQQQITELITNINNGTIGGGVHVGSSAPDNKKMLWVDTTTTTGGLKHHNGSSWVHTPVAYS